MNFRTSVYLGLSASLLMALGVYYLMFFLDQLVHPVTISVENSIETLEGIVIP